MTTTDDTDELTALREENERLRRTVAEYEGAINWGTTCLSCSDVLDASYRSHVEAGRAKAKLSALAVVVDEMTEVTDYVVAEKLGNESTIQACRHLGAKARAARAEDEEAPGLLGTTHSDLAGPRLRVEGHWLVQEVDRHTCGTGPGGHYGAHEPGCGLEPVLDLSTLPGWVGTREDEAFAQAVAKEVWERTRDTLVVQTVEAAVRKALEVR